jgi:hypothetical protein
MLDDSERAAAVEAYVGGVINLRAVAWAYHRRSLQTGQPVSAEAIMADCEAAGRKVSRTAAYRALQGIGASDPQSRISGPTSAVPHIGTGSRPGIPESGTASPGKRDSAVPESRKAGLESAPLINPQDQEIKTHPPTPLRGAVCVGAEVSKPEPDAGGAGLDWVPQVPEHEPDAGPHSPSPQADREAVLARLRSGRFGVEQARISPQWYGVAEALLPKWNAAWVDELVRDEMAKGPAKRPGYYRPILVRWMEQGGPDSAMIAARPGHARPRYAPPAPRPSPSNLLVSHRKDRSA